jgi:hypothetical protein
MTRRRWVALLSVSMLAGGLIGVLVAAATTPRTGPPATPTRAVAVSGGGGGLAPTAAPTDAGTGPRGPQATSRPTVLPGGQPSPGGQSSGGGGQLAGTPGSAGGGGPASTMAPAVQPQAATAPVAPRSTAPVSAPADGSVNGVATPASVSAPASAPQTGGERPPATPFSVEAPIPQRSSPIPTTGLSSGPALTVPTTETFRSQPDVAGARATLPPRPTPLVLPSPVLGPATGGGQPALPSPVVAPQSGASSPVVPSSGSVTRP